MLRDFIAIDFETVNQEPSSVCSVGVVMVRDGQVVDSFYSLIQPEPNYYSYWCQRVHGITQIETDDAPIYQMDYPDYRFYDTLTASRRQFGQSLPNHQLHTVAAVCGYDLQNHHHALADAEACAAIALYIL